MDLVVVTDGYEDTVALVDAAASAGWQVVRVVNITANPAVLVVETEPDAVVFVVDQLGDNIIREMATIREKYPLPVVVMTHDKLPESIDAAVAVGCTTYVVDCSDPGRIPTLLQVAKSRFRSTQRLSRELEKTRTELADRKYIDRAKGILMETRGVGENEAFQLLRKMAMDRNKRLGEVAEQIIAAAEVLISP